MPADQNPRTERLIAEPLSVWVGIDRTSPQKSGCTAMVATPNAQDAPLPPEAKRIVDALQAICALPDKTVVSWCGRPHQILKPHYANAEKGTQLIGRAGAERAAQIFVAPVDEPNQHIFSKFSVVPNGKYAPGKPRFFLECEGNPTTLITGNNVLPVTSRDPKTKKLERFPSSARNVMTTLNRLLFHFLEEIAAQAMGNDEDLFEPSTRQAIDGGDFHISHIQWCCYLPADVSRMLQVLVALFAPPAKTKVGYTSLAKQMGLRFDYETDERSSRVNAVMFEKRYGKNPAYSVDFYNKKTRTGQMKQGLTLSDEELDLIKNNVRFDMTAHVPAIMKIINDAKRHLEAHRDYFSQLPEARYAEGFYSNKPKPTARWLEFAVFILSHQPVKSSLQRGSFARYLVPLYLNEVLNLTSIVNFSLERLWAFGKEVDHPVAEAWRQAKKFDSRQWAQSLAKVAGCDDNVVYECQKQWLTTYNLDIEIPRVYYRDLQLLSAVAFLDDAERDAHVAAQEQPDNGSSHSLLNKAKDDFLRQMKTFVGGPIASPPTLLPAKVVGEVVGLGDKSRDRLASGNGAPTRTAPTKPPTRLRKPGRRTVSKRSLAEDVGHPSTQKTLREGIERLRVKFQQAQTQRERELIQRELETANRLLASYGEKKNKRRQALKESRARHRFQRMSGPREPALDPKDDK